MPRCDGRDDGRDLIFASVVRSNLGVEERALFLEEENGVGLCSSNSFNTLFVLSFGPNGEAAF